MLRHAALNSKRVVKEVFKKCFDLWFDELRNYITYRCCDEALATDIVQEAFLKVWEKKLEYQGEQTKGLLYKIAIDLWISQYRKQQSEKKYRLSFSWKQSYNETEELLYYEEMKGKYEMALAALPEKRRQVFLMSRMDGLTYQEIADRLELSVKAVEKRMKLALEELRKKLNYET